MLTDEQQEAEEFVIKVYRLLQSENPDYRIAFFSFLTLAAGLSQEMGMETPQFMHYANAVLDNNRDMKISELQ
jgi:UDP-N-acetylglucosamine:LPS N-acetylglucosamine transferase